MGRNKRQARRSRRKARRKKIFKVFTRTLIPIDIVGPVLAARRVRNNRKQPSRQVVRVRPQSNIRPDCGNCCTSVSTARSSRRTLVTRVRPLNRTSAQTRVNSSYARLNPTTGYAQRTGGRIQRRTPVQNLVQTAAPITRQSPRRNCGPTRAQRIIPIQTAKKHPATAYTQDNLDVSELFVENGRFEPVSKNGISSFRPELISILNFQPILNTILAFFHNIFYS